MPRSINLRRMSSSLKSYSSCSCIYKIGSERPSIKNVIANGSRLDELYLGSYLPLREKRILNRLRKTREAYDEAAIQSICLDRDSIFSGIEMLDDNQCHICDDDQCSCLNCNSELNNYEEFLINDEYVKPSKLISKSSMYSNTVGRNSVRFKTKQSQSDPFTSTLKNKKMHRFRSTHKKKPKDRPEPMLEPLRTFEDGIQPKDKKPLKRSVSKETQGSFPIRKDSILKFRKNISKNRTNLKPCDCKSCIKDNCAPENCSRRVQDAYLLERYRNYASSSKTSMLTKHKKHSIKTGRKKDKNRLNTAEKKTIAQSFLNSFNKRSSGSIAKLMPNDQFLTIECDPEICGTQPCNPIVCSDIIQNHILRDIEQKEHHMTAEKSTPAESLHTNQSRNKGFSKHPKLFKRDNQDILRKSTGSSTSLGKRKIKHSRAEYKRLHEANKSNRSSTSRTRLKTKFVTSSEKLPPNECDPNVCIPGECDPVNCDKIIQKRIRKPVENRHFKTKSKSSKMPDNSDVAQKNILSNNNEIKKINKERYQIQSYNTPSQTTSLKKKRKRALAKCICFKFGENLSKMTAASITTKLRSSRSNPKKLKQSKAININKFVASSENLPPYECDPNVCIPGECDPVVCEKIIQRRITKPVKTRQYTIKSKSSKMLVDSDVAPKNISSNKNKLKKLDKEKYPIKSYNTSSQTIFLKKNHKKALLHKCICFKFSKNLSKKTTDSGITKLLSSKSNPKKLKQSKTINITKFVTSSENLPSYECDPNVCIPGECDPVNCNKIIQKKITNPDKSRHHKAKFKSSKMLVDSDIAQKNISSNNNEIKNLHREKYQIQSHNTSSQTTLQKKKHKGALSHKCICFKFGEIFSKKTTASGTTKDSRSNSKKLKKSKAIISHLIQKFSSTEMATPKENLSEASQKTHRSQSRAIRLYQKEKPSYVRYLKNKDETSSLTASVSKPIYDKNIVGGLKISSSISFSIKLSKNKAPYNEDHLSFNKDAIQHKKTKEMPKKLSSSPVREQSWQGKRNRITKSVTKIKTKNESSFTGHITKRCFCTQKSHKFGSDIKNQTDTKLINKGVYTPDKLLESVSFTRNKSTMMKHHKSGYKKVQVTPNKRVKNIAFEENSSKNKYDEKNIPDNNLRYTSESYSSPQILKLSSNFKFNLEFSKNLYPLNRDTIKKKPSRTLDKEIGNNKTIDKTVSSTSRQILKRCFCTLQLHKKEDIFRRKGPRNIYTVSRIRETKRKIFKEIINNKYFEKSQESVVIFRKDYVLSKSCPFKYTNMQSYFRRASPKVSQENIGKIARDINKTKLVNSEPYIVKDNNLDIDFLNNDKHLTTDINPFSKNYFCTMNLQLSNEKKKKSSFTQGQVVDNLKPHECECQKVMMKRSKTPHECECQKGIIIRLTKTPSAFVSLAESKEPVREDVSPEGMKPRSLQTKQSVVKKAHSGLQPDFQKTTNKGLGTIRERCFCTLKLHKTGRLEKKRKEEILVPKNKLNFTKISQRAISTEKNGTPSNNALVGNDIKNKSSLKGKTESVVKATRLISTSPSPQSSESSKARKSPIKTLLPSSEVDDKNPSLERGKQAIRITSNVSFSITLAKRRQKSNDYLEEEKINGKTKELSFSNNSRLSKITAKYLKNVNLPKLRQKIRTKRAIEQENVSESSNTQIMSDVKPFFKRCFCSLSFKRPIKQKTYQKMSTVGIDAKDSESVERNTQITSKVVAKSNTLKSYECNPYKCLQFIKKRRFKHTGSNTMTTVPTSASSIATRHFYKNKKSQSSLKQTKSFSSFKSEPLKPPHRKYQSVKNHFAPSQPVVRIGSTFSFNIGFYKDKNPSVETSNGVNVPLQRKSNDSLLIQNQNLFNHSNYNLDNKHIKNPHTISNKAKAKMGVIHPFFKRCFCILSLKNIKKKPKLIHTLNVGIAANNNLKPSLQSTQTLRLQPHTINRGLDAYESKPGVCMHGSCNPYQYKKRIEREQQVDHNLYRDLGTNPKLNLKTVYSTASLPTFTQKNMQLNDRRRTILKNAPASLETGNASRLYEEAIVLPNTLKSSSGQAVRIGSTFSFNIEFSKNKSPAKDEGLQNYKNYRRPHHQIKQQIQDRKKKLISTSSQSTKKNGHKHVGNQSRITRKKYFDMGTKPNKRYIQSGHHGTQTFVPTIGKSSVLIETDYLNIPKHQHRGNATLRKRFKNKSANNLKRRSSHKNDFQRIYLDKKPYRKKNNLNVNSDSQIRPSRQAVKIGSTFSFNIEFFKDQIGISDIVAKEKIPTKYFNKHYLEKSMLERPRRKERRQPRSKMQTTAYRRIPKKVDSKGLIKRCFCNLQLKRKINMKKFNVATSPHYTSLPKTYMKDVSLGSHECQTGICVSGQCDPYECLRLKHRDFGTLPKRHKVKSVFSVSQPYNYQHKKNQFNAALPRTKNFKAQYSKPISGGMRKKIDKISIENISCNPSRQAVRIGSSCSFNIEFYKDKLPGGDAPTICKRLYKTTTPEKELQSKNIKRKKNIVNSRVQTLPYSHLHPKFNKKVGANRIVHYDTSEIQTLNDSKNNLNKMAYKTVQCQPGTCVVGQCDPYECDVNKRNASVTAKREKKSMYSIESSKPQKHKKIQFNSYLPVPENQLLIRKCKENVNCPGNLYNQIYNAPKSKQAVKVGSNFSFNVEFFKERPNKYSIQNIPIKKRKIREKGKIKHSSTEYIENHTFLRRCLCLLRPRKTVKAQTERTKISKFKTANNATETDKIYISPKVNKAINVKNRVRLKDTGTRSFRKGSKYFSSIRRKIINSKANMRMPYANQYQNKTNYTYVIEKKPAKEVNCNRQAVRIGSSFNFNVEFYKNKWPFCETPCIQPPLKKVIKSYPQSLQKVFKTRKIGTKVKSPKYIHRKSYAKPRRRKSVGQESDTEYNDFKGQINPLSKNRDFNDQTPSGCNYTSQIEPIKYVHRGAEGRLPKHTHRRSQMEPRLKRGMKSQISNYKNRELQAEPIQRKDATGGDCIDCSHRQSQIVPRRNFKAIGTADEKFYCTANPQIAGDFIRDSAVGTHKKCYCTANLQTAGDFVRETAVGTHAKSKCYCTANLQTDGDFLKESAVGTHSIPRYPKMHKQTEIYGLLPYECEAGTCIPGECNPFECAERIKRRLRSQGMSTSPTRFSQAAVVPQATPITKSKGIKTPKEKQFARLKQPICLDECNVDYCCQDKQAVKIGSTFSFSVEFFKNKNKRCNENSVQFLQSFSNKNKNNTKYRSRNSQVKKKLIDEKSSGVNNLVKRCFCNLKPYKNQIQKLKYNNSNKIVTVNRCDVKEFRNDTFENKQFWVQYHTVHYNRIHKAGGDQTVLSKSTATTLKQNPVSLNTNICKPYDCNPNKCKAPKCKHNILQYFRRKKIYEMDNDDIETIYPYRPNKYKKYASQSLSSNSQIKNRGRKYCTCVNKCDECDRYRCHQHFILGDTKNQRKLHALNSQKSNSFETKKVSKNKVRFSRKNKVQSYDLESEDMLQNDARVAERTRIKKHDGDILQNRMQTDKLIRQHKNQHETKKEYKGQESNKKQSRGNRDTKRPKSKPPNPNDSIQKKNEGRGFRNRKKYDTKPKTKEERKLEERLRKEQMKERYKHALRYRQQDKQRIINRINRDNLKNKGVPKYKHHSPAALVFGSVLDLATLGVRAFADVFRITYRKIKHRDLCQPSANKKEIARMNTKLKLRTTCRTAGGAGTFYRIRKRLIEIPFISRVGYVITNIRNRRRRHFTNPGCNIFLETLRHKPCLWVHDISPWFYPHCLSLLAAWRQFSDIMLFLLAILVWCPCILCVEFCRAILCCFVCTQ